MVMINQEFQAEQNLAIDNLPIGEEIEHKLANDSVIILQRLSENRWEVMNVTYDSSSTGDLNKDNDAFASGEVRWSVTFYTIEKAKEEYWRFG